MAIFLPQQLNRESVTTSELTGSKSLVRAASGARYLLTTGTDS